jgi:hypothetical protein
MSCDQAGVAISTRLVVSAFNTLFINDPDNLIIVGLDGLDYFKNIGVCCSFSTQKMVQV